MNNILINRIKKILTEQNMSKADLSRLTGISNSSLSEYLNGKYEPKQDKIALIAKALHVSPAWLSRKNTGGIKTMDVQQKVAALIRRYKTDDPFRLAACQNIIIMYSDLGGKYGNYLKYKRSKFIIIDAQRTPESMLPFVCAHELGHALCTPNVNTQWLKAHNMDIEVDRVERLANMFAVELLLNDGYLAEHPGTSIYTLANCRGVPHRFIKLKKSGRDI